MSTSDGVVEPSDDDDPPIDVRIDAALTLTTDAPSTTAIDLLEDRRIALRWRFGLSLAGFALLVLVAFASGRIDGPGPLLVTLVALGAALGGGLGGWWIERTRLAARTAEAVFTRREKLLLLTGMHRGRSAERAPVPLLRELARWRIDAAVPELLMIGGAFTAFNLPGIIGGVDGTRWWGIVIWIVVGVLALGTVIATLRERERCRRFLVDSAGWPSAEGTTAQA